MCGICFICTLVSGWQAEEQSEHIDDVSKSGLDFFGKQSWKKSSQETVETLFTDPLLHHRGPDNCAKHPILLTEGIVGYMQGCVLHLRGQITPQPIKDETGNALMWNGEIFDGIQVEEHENDTQVLFSHLVSSITEEDILKTMQMIHGPWAFIFWQTDTQKLWFGRDMFGRRSLLWHLPSSISDHLVLSSVALGGMTYTEVPSVGIFCLDFSTVSISGCVNSCPSLTLHPWNCCRWPGTSVKVIETKEADILNFLYPKLPSCIVVSIDKTEKLNSWIPDVNNYIQEADQFLLHSNFDVADFNSLENMLTHILENTSDLNALADELLQVLQQSVDKRVNNLPRNFHICIQPPNGEQNIDAKPTDYKLGKEYFSPEPEGEMNQPRCPERRNETSCANVAILFSGGLDSTILAALADRCVPEDEPIDLLNVAFEQPSVTSLIKNKPKKQQKSKKKNCNGTQHNSSPETRESIRNHGGLNKSQNDACDGKESSWEQGVSCNSPASHEKIGILANGPSATSPLRDLLIETGKTSSSPQSVQISPCLEMAEHSLEYNTTNTNKVHDCHTYNSIENVQPSDSCLDPFDVPDRHTGRIALSELNPNRKWNFIEINISQSELQDLRKSHIRKLIYPLQTVLDDSIGCAVWFAARGSGVLSHDKRQPFVSLARVILCGMAADEQFAGYSRHRVTFQTKGWDGLFKEIQEEMWRISARNLGRDDRIITDHGKECRFPFLDETFTQFVSSIPVHKRADLRLPRGVGDKVLLRLCALKLGLVKTAVQPKRAIQFGSKIAKLDHRKEKGSDVCERLT